LAVVAIVQTLPEFFVEGTIAWKAGQQPSFWRCNVIANSPALTDYARTCWPLILITLGFRGGGSPERRVRAYCCVSFGGASIEVAFY